MPACPGIQGRAGTTGVPRAEPWTPARAGVTKVMTPYPSNAAVVFARTSSAVTPGAHSTSRNAD